MIKKRSERKFVKKRDVSRNAIFMMLVAALVLTVAGTIVSVNTLSSANFGGSVITGAVIADSGSSFSFAQGVALIVIGLLVVILLIVYFEKRYFKNKAVKHKIVVKKVKSIKKK